MEQQSSPHALAAHQPVATTNQPPITPQPCRLGSVELVCRRFRDLSRDAPQLHLTAVVLQSHFLSALVRVRSLAEWLIKRGGSVQRLNMQLSVNLRSEGSTAEGDGLDFESEATDRGDQLELLTEALQAVAFCAARGSLSELQLCFEYLPAFRFSSATAAALAGLRKFSLTVQGGGIPDEQDLFDGLLAVVGPLHIMTGLRELHLKGCPLHLKPRLRLPPGLTQLHLGSDVERTFDRLPKQVGSCTCNGANPAAARMVFPLGVRIGLMLRLLLQVSPLPTCLSPASP